MSASDQPKAVEAGSDGGYRATDQISPLEASYWWRKATSTGALLNKLMVLFIVVPVVLVLKNFYALSFVVFVLMVPYGFFLRHLAVRAVKQHLLEHPEDREQFLQLGIISS